MSGCVILRGDNMGFTVNFYTFSKKVNSTKRPSSGATSYDCILKDPSGILNPTIGLNIGLTTSPIYNYAYIPVFGRYYFVKEWNYQNALWYASLDVDPLASWKTEIGSSNCYVLRSYSEHDEYIMDNAYPATGKTTIQDSEKPTPWNTTNLNSGLFVIGITGKRTTYYGFTNDNLNAFLDYLFSDSYLEDLVGSWGSVFPQLKAQANPMQYITSLMWFPFTFTGSQVTNIYVGYVGVACNAIKIEDDSLITGSFNFTILKHPQSDRGKYMNNSPYSSYEMFFPPWGKIPLDPNIMANSDTLNVLWQIDLKTGQGTLIIEVGNETFNNVMSWNHTQVGISIQVSQIINRGFGIGNLIPPALSVGSATATGNAMFAIGGVASAVGDFANSQIPSASTIGSSGGMDSLRGTPALQYQFKEVVEDDIVNKGQPLCKTRTISSLSGYIKTSNPYINSSATQNEKNSILSYMEGGFFYE